MLNAAAKSTFDILGRNVVTTLNHPLAHTADGFARIGNPNEMEFDPIVPFHGPLKRFTYVFLLRVDSSPKVHCWSISSRSSVRRSLPALSPTASGCSGDNPRAISSAFRKRITPMLGRNSFAKVVLPAPLQPAIR